MAKKEIKFNVFKTVQKPTTVKFHTNDGKLVVFKAVVTEKRMEPVKFRAKK